MLLQHRLRIGGWVGKQEILLRYITGSAGSRFSCMVINKMFMIIMAPYWDIWIAYCIVESK